MVSRKVLDHGYVDFIESWGSDETVICSARMSTNKGFQGWGPFCSKCGMHVVVASDGVVSPANYEQGEQKACEHDAAKPGDEKLLKYLWENQHRTPFEMCGATFEVQGPIFVFREFMRHRTLSYNELSARYTPLPDVNYVPSLTRVLMNAGGTNRQAGTIAGAQELTGPVASQWQDRVRAHYEAGQALYEDGLSQGVPKELARVVVPVGRYSRMRVSGNLRNWTQFLTLRLDEKAQWEIRQYAKAVHEILWGKFPRTMELFDVVSVVHALGGDKL